MNVEGPASTIADERSELDLPGRARRRARVPAVAVRQRRRILGGRRRTWVIAIIGVVLVLPVAAMVGWTLVTPAIVAGAAARHFPADTLVFDRHGALIADIHKPGTSRRPVPLKQIAPSVLTATVDVEDRNFWTEGGVDTARLLSAAVHNAAGGSVQGGSTIAMQLAKIIYLEDSRTLSYKIQDITLAQHLSDAMSKDDLIDAYLNDIDYGSGAQGIEAAAQTYFGIDASALDLAHAAYLAGLPKSPTLYDPFVHPQAAHERALYVLQAMRNAGDITSAQQVAAGAEPISLADGNADNVDRAPGFVSFALGEVHAVSNGDVRTAGLRITTTLDLNDQQHAQQMVTAQVAGLQGLHVTDGALVSLDPQTGEILAYVGSAGAGVPGGDIDMASTPRQPGSTFKLFTYSSAIADRTATMLTPVLDGPLSFPIGGGADGLQPYAPLDYDLQWHGVLPLELALGNSLNVPAIRVEMAEGIPKIVDRARSMGVTTLTAPDSAYGPSTTLGTVEIPLWQMAQAAGVLADGGTLHPAHAVRSITLSNGTVVTPPPASPKAVLAPEVAAIMNNVLSTDSNRWMEFGQGGLLTLPGHAVAAKTGTTQNFKDNLTIGWVPSLVTATWVGNADDSPMQGTTGITGAAPIWHDYMSFALGNAADNWPPNPPGVYLATDGTYNALLLVGTTPTLGANLLGAEGAPGGGEGDNNQEGNGSTGKSNCVAGRHKHC